MGASGCTPLKSRVRYFTGRIASKAASIALIFAALCSARWRTCDTQLACATHVHVGLMSPPSEQIVVHSAAEWHCQYVLVSLAISHALPFTLSFPTHPVIEFAVLDHCMLF